MTTNESPAIRTTACTCPADHHGPVGDAFRHLPVCADVLDPADGLPCEGCEGTSGLVPVTTLGYCPDCRDAAIRNHGQARALQLVGTIIRPAFA